MLNNNSHNHKSCEFAEQMVSYLYGEITVGEVNKFEKHLNGCSSCTDELTAFAAVRSSVADWRGEEFVKLETPAFQIPADNSAKSVVSAAGETVSWRDGFRRAFSFDYGWATAALGVLAVCAVAAFFAIRFSGDADFAENRIAVNSTQIRVSPTIETTETAKTVRQTKPDDQTNVSAPPSNNKDNKSDDAAVTKREKPFAADKSIVKVANNDVRSSPNSSIRNAKDESGNTKKIAPVQKRKVPVLIEVDEDEDDSIRLSDLFAELDTK